MLMADNYFLGRNHQDLDLLTGIQKEIITETFTGNSNPEECKTCKNREVYAAITFAYIEINQCPSCGKNIKQDSKISLMDEWLTFSSLSRQSNSIKSLHVDDPKKSINNK